MLSTAISRIAAAALFAISATAAATGSDKPPRFLTVPVLGLRVPLDRLNLDQFPEDIRVKCDQLYDEDRYTAYMWVFGRARDAASTYYVLSGYYKWRNPGRDRRPYEVSDHGTVFTVTGDKCGGDGAGETFDVHDPNADNHGNVPDRILKVLARDLAAQTVKAVGGPDRLRAEIKSQRIDFDALSPELQEAFKPYFQATK
jgi:hypothetical protein